jgi:O-antigen/teichoic acid export membrane protein
MLHDTRSLPASSPRYVAYWIRHGGSVVLDQVLYSGANFIINILLARWLSEIDYGAFALASSLLFFLAALHTSILIEPMLVFGARKYADRFPFYLGTLLYGHGLLTVAFSLVISAAALIISLVGSTTLAATLWAFAGASPWILLSFFTRRAFYVLSKPIWSALGSAIYFAIIIAAALALDRARVLSAGNCILAMGCAGAVTGFILLIILRPGMRRVRGSGMWKEVSRDHWGYGQWAIGSSLLTSSHGTLYFTVVAAFLSLGSVATLRAIQNLFAPLSQVTQAITSLLIPWAARRSVAKGPNQLTSDAVRISLLLVVAAILYGVTMATVGVPIADILYAGKYSGQGQFILLIALIYVLGAAGGGASIALRSSARSDLVFILAVMGSSVSLAGNLLLAPLLGFLGAVIGIGLFPVLCAILAWWLWLSKGRKRHSQIVPETPGREVGV